MLKRYPATVTAVVLAGGIGRRIAGEVPKQLMEVAGKTLLERSVGAFAEHDMVDEVLVVMAAEFHAQAERTLRSSDLAVKPEIIAGGRDRSDSTAAALRYLNARHDGARKVLIHDAARPLVSQRLIGDVVDRLEAYSAVDVAIGAADTMITTTTDVEGEEILESVPERSRLRRVQTPQGFRLDVLSRAFDGARDDPDFQVTDDCSVVHRYLPDVDVSVVAGEETNFKVTRPIDMVMADTILRLPRQDDDLDGALRDWVTDRNP
ncbi:IspD/TarI family cytidylyltransferase [Haloglycomyces albus]|uniref:IspD/TarI family cytidylyltransferase n=1 Tax=Haloglycomyces albus TaxID=526067 RepID=UPI00046D5530|nr:IspD/TarI family cytidylyltransferase [Haloglycomyces albus]